VQRLVDVADDAKLAKGDGDLDCAGESPIVLPDSRFSEASVCSVRGKVDKVTSSTTSRDSPLEISSPAISISACSFVVKVGSDRLCVAIGLTGGSSSKVASNPNSFSSLPSAVT
jgi:hypothetical protein